MLFPASLSKMAARVTPSSPTPHNPKLGYGYSQPAVVEFTYCNGQHSHQSIFFVPIPSYFLTILRYCDKTQFNQTFLETH